jgi:hypothetical protein
LLNVRPGDLLSREASVPPLEPCATREPRATRERPALRRVPPSWRTCRVRMSRAHFVGIVTAWISGLALLIAVALTVRWS